MNNYMVEVPEETGITVDRVVADYVQYPMGMLVFKRTKQDRNSYPEIVKIYAPGGWLNVTLEEFPDDSN
jgi:hypothetical protein